MCAWFRGPRVTGVNDGSLILYLDAANTSSYPGMYTVWNDLSGNVNTGTLVNGPTFSSDNMGSIVFDGITAPYYDYVNIPITTSQSATILTVCAWVKSMKNDSTYQQGIIAKANLNGSEFGWILRKGKGYPTQSNDNKFYFSTNTASRVLYPRADFATCSNLEYTDNNWHYIVGLRNSLAVNKIYIDGILQTASRTGSVIDLTTSPQPIVIGSCYGDLPLNTTYQSAFHGFISLVKIYNYALTDAEVLQNYNATKSRYGL